MIKKIDVLGRIVIPKEIRDFLDLKNLVKLEVVDDKIIITKIAEK